MPDINYRLRLPDELLLLTFSFLRRSDVVPLARCSHHFRQLALPLIWDDVTARLSWVATRRVCMVARRPHIAPLVHRFDVGRQRDSQWYDDIDVLPTLAATLSRLSNLRRLSFAVGDRLDCGSLDGCYFPHLEALSMPFTRGNVSFVKRHPGITSLFSPRPYTFELFKAMGTGKPLQAFSGDLNLMLEVLGTQRSLNQSSRLLDSGCYIALFGHVTNIALNGARQWLAPASASGASAFTCIVSSGYRILAVYQNASRTWIRCA